MIPHLPITRRSFLAASGAGLVGAPLASATPAPRGARASDEKKLGWAIVGLGYYATKVIMPRFKECEHSRLTALVSGSPAKAKALAQEYGLPESNIYGYANFDAIRDNPDVDVVYVVLPNSMHAEYTIRAANAGKHVLCEKPMAVSVRECEQMIAACRRAGKKLMIGYRSRFEPHNVRAIETLRSGELGPIQLLNAEAGFAIGDPDQWRLKRALSGGGSLMDIGIYALQAARYLTGEEPAEVTAQIHSTPNDPRFREVEENVLFQLRFPSGVIADCVSSYGAGTNRYRAVTARGMLEMEPATGYSGHQLRIRRPGKPVEPVAVAPGPEVQFARHIDHLSICAKENREPLVPGEEGLRDVRLMRAIYEAGRTGRVVRV